ncbi:MAG TPA: porin family protein [Flavilitoribacter sp.]|nr:PorT family protein [Lewinella sp.]MCB9278174.1 PorT family protein [Lewinellaceae bacterium]HMQ60043.1 porin family protein [Flavilitoribacter sp.]HMQ86567.1 porin family protein [Flavilitoribacter sp.]
MRKEILFTLLTVVLTISYGYSQLRIGIRAGASTEELSPDDFNVIENGVDRLNIALKDAKYGVHAGLVIQARFNNFLFQPEILLNSNKVDFQVEDLQNPGTVVKEEKYQYLDVPVLLGYKFGPLRLHAGPVGHIYLNSTSDLTDFEGYKQDFKSMTLGWQGGLGIDIWKLMIDLRYEGNFNKFGDHITFGNTSYAFDETPARFLFSLGFMFGKNSR